MQKDGKEFFDEGKLKEKAAKISIAEGSAYSVMDGFGLKYITPYALALGVSNAFIGLLSSLPTLIGNISQIPGSKIVEKYPRKKIVISSVIMQAFMWLPLILIGILSYFLKFNLLLTSLLLILTYTILITFGAFIGPAWSSWMKDIITKNTDSYFARRNLIAGLVGLASTFIAGFLLDWLNKYHFLLGFGVIFSIALIGRGISAYLFTKKYEPKYVVDRSAYFSFFDFVKRMKNNNFGRFVIFSAVIGFAVGIASPFFAVYMLKDLGFSYANYTLVVTSAILVTLFSMPLWGRIGDKYGNIKVLKLTGTFIFLIPVLYLFIQFFGEEFSFSVFVFVIFIEVLSGFLWAGFNLSSGTFVYYAVTPQRLPYCVAYNSVIASFGAFVGASIGGILSSFDFPIFGMKPILFVFALSGFFRVVAIIVFLPKIKEVREVEKFGLKEEIKNEFKRFTKWPRNLLEILGLSIQRPGGFGFLDGVSGIVKTRKT